jgi:hypothetical protein
VAERTQDGLALYEMSSVEKRAAERVRDGSREDKVQLIYDLSVRLRFERGRTTRDLALIWGMTDEAVSRMAMEAKRQIVQAARLTVLSPEDLRFELFTTLEAILTDAMHAKKEVVTKDGDVVVLNQPDRLAAIHAVGKMSELFGLGSRRMIEQGNQLKQQLEGSLEDKAASLLREIRAAKGEIETQGVGKNDDEADRVLEQPHPPDAGEKSLARGTGGGDENRNPRVRSSDYANGGPGAPSGAPRRVRKNPQVGGGAKRGGRNSSPPGKEEG